MMLKYQDKKQIKKKKKMIKSTIWLSVFFIVASLGFWSFFGGPLNFVSRPVLKIGNWISSGFDNIGYYFSSKSKLTKENEIIKEENSLLKLKMLDYEIVKSENLELKKVLSRLPGANNFILANILTKPNRSLYDTIIVDTGKKDGVTEGALVYAYGEIPIGRTSEVYDNTSLVTLYSSPGQKTEGIIDGVLSSVELVGRGGGNFETIVPVELTLQNGSIIYIPGFSAKVLAVVKSVISDPSDPFKKVILSSPVNIESLKWVQIKK